MANWINRITGRQKSAQDAKERLKLVLIHDRTDISPQKLENIKDDLLQTISNHIQIEPDKVTISMVHEGREQRLIADIPLKIFSK